MRVCAPRFAHPLPLLLLLWLAASASPAQLPAQRPAQAAASRAARSVPDSLVDFGGLVARLSERGGYFNTDNLISNEASYLHVMGSLDRLDIRGGAYIGVGPDQNFSYIARIKPRIAFLLDIRRDNMLQHLMFKALFAHSDSRAEYLALLLGRPLPPMRVQQAGAALPAIVAAIDSLAPTETSRREAIVAVQSTARRFGVPLTAQDVATIERFHRAFIDQGLSLRFTTTGRAPRYYYPTLRELLLERDADGQLASYLARESDFQFLKSMQRRNLLVPVVGDLGGPHAVRAVATYLQQHDVQLSAMYVSNAEDYLLRGGSFGAYVQSVATIPRSRTSVIIRSWFGGPGSHPASVGDYYSTQLLQRVDDFLDVAPSVRYYRELVQQRFVPLR